MSDYYAICSDNYLNHHGILGQKWGVRRFQNKDGSYTTAGKERRNGFREAKEKISLKLKDPKVKRALKIGASVAVGALALYGGYKMSKYLNDQKVIMALNEHADSIKRVIPNYKANIVAMNRGLAPKDHLNEYMKGLNVNRQKLSEINAMSGSIAKKHLYNFGEHMTIGQYNNAVSAGKNLAKATGKTAVSALKGGLRLGKEVAQFIMDNSSSIAEILKAMS